MPVNGLDYISIQGFKSIADIKNLTLRPINVVIGSNGSGKSNFLGVFSFLHAIAEGRLWEYVKTAGGAERLLHFGLKTTKRIRFSLLFAHGQDQYDLVLSPSEEDVLFPSKEFLCRKDKKRIDLQLRPLSTVQQNREAGISEDTSKLSYRIRQHLASWRVYHLHDTSSSSLIRKTAQVNDNEFLRSDASNLASFLYLLQERYPAAYEMIRRTVQQVAPFFEDFQLKPQNLNPNYIQLGWRHKNSDQYFNASTLSDGTLRFIALATLFLQPETLRPSIILVDEPELGLHPSAVALLAALIRQASPESQVIMSTQSSLLLDYFEPSEILVANRVEGATELTRLDPERLADWLTDYSLGQLWEKNEIGGRPVPD